MRAAMESMDRALALARLAQGSTRPNPPVGAVLERDGEVVGEGHTQPPGGPHAEIVALHTAGDRARGATLFVTLEPCSHHGRTPPCADALLIAGVARVVAAVADPNPRVNGAGFARLRAAGVAVEVGPGAVAARELLEGHTAFITTGRPQVVAHGTIPLDLTADLRRRADAVGRTVSGRLHVSLAPPEPEEWPTDFPGTPTGWNDLLRDLGQRQVTTLLVPLDDPAAHVLLTAGWVDKLWLGPDDAVPPGYRAAVLASGGARAYYHDV